MKTESSRRRGRWLRATISLSISGGLLTILFSRLNIDVLRQTLANLNISVMGVGVLMFGLFILIGSLRWRVALQASVLHVPFPTLLRASLVGHLFNMAFFGPVGGDLAKTAAYARWHNYGLAELLATAVADRSFAALGSVILILFTVIVFLVSPSLPTITLRPTAANPGGILLLGLLLALVVTLVVLKLRKRPFFTQFFETFSGLARQLKRSPLRVLSGCLLGFSAQVVASYLILVCLFAVGSPLEECLKMLWVFPVIGAVAALPFSVGGSGLRESAALILLSGCGVAAEHVVIAGLLVLAVYVAWGLVALPVFVWEEYQHSIRRNVSSEPVE
jgi:uncharacterized membrane protein YbhN (UPF0104 family)